MANAIKAKNPNLEPNQVLRIVESKIGKLYWSSEKESFGTVVPEGQGEEFYLKSTGRGTLNARPRSEKRNRRGRNESTRKQNIRISTPENVNRRGAAAKANRIRAQGLEVDHINEVSRTGPVLAAYTPEERKRYQSLIASGDQADNYQALSGPDNRRKNRELRKLDRYLNKKEVISPSPTLQKLLNAFKDESKNQEQRLNDSKNGVSPRARFKGFPSATLGESAPLGGNLIDTDPFGSNGLLMRTG